MASSRAVTVAAASWGWRHAGRHAWAVRDLSFRIEPGERVLLLGASGSGKSTVLAGLAGVLGGDDDGESTGSLLLDGLQPAEARGRSGLVLQDPDSQIILARVGDDVAFACENLGVPRERIWPRVAQALEAVGLDVPLSHPTSALSGGQKQRLALAGLLAMQPGLLLLDEPTANLDPEGVLEIRDAVRRTLEQTGATLVVVEHRVTVWLDVIDRIIVLDAQGGLIADGSADDVLVRHAAALTAAGVWLPARTGTLRAKGKPGESLLSTAGLTVARRGGAPIVIEDAVVRSGTACAVTGRNGSGKTTFALTLGGLLAPHSGRVTASRGLAEGAGDNPIRWSSAQLLTRIGSVFQNPEHQILGSTVQADLEIGPRALGSSEGDIRRTVDHVLQRLQLDSLAKANPFTLSGGQKRRLSVATAIVAGPRVLVLDEPTFGQDALTWQELVDLLADLRDDGHCIVAATHDEDFVRALDADVVALCAPASLDPGNRNEVTR